MNPEFERNLWLEMKAGRMLVLAVVLALLFFFAALAGGNWTDPGTMARWSYYVLVVLWGTRNAARSVVGEILDRTWDGQRLSSLGAGSMMWGKLFGATIFNWFGGVLCLLVILAGTYEHSGPAVALFELAYLLALGVISQSVSFLASLIAVGRRRGRTQFEVFVYQGAGILAGVAVWAIADPFGPVTGSAGSTILWWGIGLPAQPFLLLSLAAFAAWTLTGCYREMRLELKLTNGPLVWLGFLLFSGLYVAGFDAWLSTAPALTQLGTLARRLFLAGTAYGVLGYVMAILERKDRVRLRWLGGAFGHFRLGRAFKNLQGWMMSYLAALIIGIALVVCLMPFPQDQAVSGAMLGFFTRDLAIIVLCAMLARGRGDFTALAMLVLLYALLPAILSGLHFSTALLLPQVSTPIWLSPLAAWIEALLAWGLTVANIALPAAEKSS
jgi:hypothetical protein